MELQLRSLHVGYCTACPMVVSLLFALCLLLFVMF